MIACVPQKAHDSRRIYIYCGGDEGHPSERGRGFSFRVASELDVRLLSPSQACASNGPFALSANGPTIDELPTGSRRHLQFNSYRLSESGQLGHGNSALLCASGNTLANVPQRRRLHTRIAPSSITMNRTYWSVAVSRAFILSNSCERKSGRRCLSLRQS